MIDPEDYLIRGRSQVHRKPTAAAGALASLQMVGSSQPIPFSTVSPGDGPFLPIIVAFDDPSTETNPRQYDPYGLRSTTALDAYVLGDGLITAGSAVVMTEALAGLWLCSTLRKTNSHIVWDVSGIYGFEHGGFLNLNMNEQHYGNVVDNWSMSSISPTIDDILLNRFTSLSATHLIELAEGDYLWSDAYANVPDGSDSELEKMVLTMVRVGALPAEPS